MKLTNDIARCVGRRSMAADATVCPKRSGCQRYIDAASGDYGERTAVVMWMCLTANLESRIETTSEDHA